MNVRVPLASSGLRSQDIEAVKSTLISGRLTMGNRVKTFESEMASYLGCKNFVMVNSGSSANLLIIEALMRPTNSKPLLKPGDGVLVPAIAWPTTVWPLIQLGLNPVFVDVDPNSLAMDLQAAQTFLDESNIPVRALFPIHPLGLSISMESLTSFAKRNELVLINDVCESLGSWSEGNHAGLGGGLAASFSFYFSHHITTMEGGGVATDDDHIADDLRSMRSHGWSRDRTDHEVWEAKRGAPDSKFLFVSTGFNLRPMEIQAAVGSLQLKDLDKFVSRRRAIAGAVHLALKGTCMQVIGEDRLPEDLSHSWMLIPIRIHNDSTKERRSKILSHLEVRGVETRPVLTGNFVEQPAVQRIFRQALRPESYSVASGISNSSFLVGAHHDLSDDQVDWLCKSLVEADRV